MIRAVTERFILFACLLIVVSVWLVQGVAIPVRVTSGSMAPNLVGLHREAICPRCNHDFAVGADDALDATRACCTACGHGPFDATHEPILPGDRVLIDRATYLWSEPKRFEVVAFRDASTGELFVKRIVGLPGESITARDGSLYVDNQSTGGDADRLDPPCIQETFQPVPLNNSSDQATIWLDHPGAQDAYAYNAGLSRELNRNREISLSAVVRMGQGSMEFLLGGATLSIDSATSAIRLSTGPGVISAVELPDNAQVDSHHVSMEWSHESLRLSWDDRTLAVWEIGAAADWSLKGCDPICGSRLTARHGRLQIRSQGAGWNIETVRIRRPIYYVPIPQGNGAGNQLQSLRLDQDEFLVLGDNRPLSDDSWTPERTPVVRRKQLVGKVLSLPNP